VREVEVMSTLLARETVNGASCSIWFHLGEMPLLVLTRGDTDSVYKYRAMHFFNAEEMLDFLVSNGQNLVYSFAKETFDDPVIRMFLDVMGI